MTEALKLPKMGLVDILCSNQLLEHVIIILSVDVSPGASADEFLTSVFGCFWQILPLLIRVCWFDG